MGNGPLEDTQTHQTVVFLSAYPSSEHDADFSQRAEAEKQLQGGG